MTDISKQIKKLKYMRLLALPIAGLMFFSTMNFFGSNFALVLGVIAGAIFFFILERGKNSIIGEALIQQIRLGIEEVGHIEDISEIKKTPKGMIVRAYLIHGDEKTPIYESAIRKNFYLNNLDSYVWKIQITNICSPDEFEERRVFLDKEIIEFMNNENGDD